MMSQKNIISKIHIQYQPGFGGNFLKLMMSLDPATVPYVCQTNDVFERLKNYNFNNSRKYRNWSEFHEFNHSKFFIDEKNPQILVVADHWYADNFADYAVDLSYDDFPNYWLVTTKIRWRNFPVLDPGEFNMEMDKRSRLSYKKISLDSFLYKHSWKKEYLRICDLMNLPIQVKAAELLYDSWYQIRVAPLAEDFKKISPLEKSNYYIIRKNQEINSPAVWWNYTIPFFEMYERVRGVDWPDCPDESDFCNLPDFVKKELTEKFNYSPKYMV
jgi:hypothetical protein